MRSIVIDDEFKGLLPALDKKTFDLLEENILQNGCRDALVLWDGVLIDGHNRYEICMKHELPFTTVNKEFPSREDALIWIITTQVSRRNLTSLQLSYFRGLHYIADRKKISNAAGRNQYSEVEPQNEVQLKVGSTAGRLASHYRVSRATIERDAKVAEAITVIGESSPAAKSKILSGEESIDKKALQELSSLQKEEIAVTAAEIEEGVYVKKKPGEPALSPDGEALPTGAADEPAEGDEPEAAITVGPPLLGMLINEMTDDFQPSLWSYAEDGNLNDLKEALRAYIDRLEELYWQI